LNCRVKPLLKSRLNCIADEFRLWAELASSGDAGAGTAKEVYQCFEPVRPIFDDIAQQSQEAVLDLVDVTHDALEKVRLPCVLRKIRKQRDRSALSGAPCEKVSVRASPMVLRVQGCMDSMHGV
jgi:hypothetical protein